MRWIGWIGLLFFLPVLAFSQGLTSQTINGFANPGAKVYSNTTFLLSTGVFATSHLAVTYRTKGPLTCATTSVTRCTLNGAGTATVTANQAGNLTYAAAPPVTQTFVVAPAPLVFVPATLAKRQGQLNPPLVYQAIGYVGTNNAGNSFTGGTGPVIATPATTNSPVNSTPGYPISVDISALSSTNYTLSVSSTPAYLQIYAAGAEGWQPNNTVQVPAGALPSIFDLATSIGLTIAGDGVTDDSAALQSVFQLQLAPSPLSLASCTYTGSRLKCVTNSPHTFMKDNYVQVTAASDPALNAAFNTALGGRGVCQLSSVTNTTFTCPSLAPAGSSTGGYVSGGRNNRGFFRAGQYMYMPGGTGGTARRYAISHQLNMLGCCITLQGDGPNRSVFYVLPNSASFNTVKPTPVLNIPGYFGNQGFRENIIGIGVDVAPGNPNAEGILYVGNNTATLENLQLTCEDSQCAVGFALTNAYNGPMLTKNVAVYGFHIQFNISHAEYSMAAENITLEGATVNGVVDEGQPVSWRHVFSSMNVPVFKIGSGSEVILDSKLLNGSSTASAITGSKGTATYTRNVVTTGYQYALSDMGTGRTFNYTTPLTETWTGAAQTLFSTGPSHGVGIPIQETPQPSDPPISTWCNIGQDPALWQTKLNACTSTTAYTNGQTDSLASQRKHFITAFSISGNHMSFISANAFVAGEQVWTAGMGVAAYINNQVWTVLSAGLSSTGFRIDLSENGITKPNQELTADTGSGAAGATQYVTVTVPSSINHINLFDRVGNPPTAYTLFRIADNARTPLILERIGYNPMTIAHTGRRTLVLEHGTFSYSSTVGAGNVFIEDAFVVGPPSIGVNAAFTQGVVFHSTQRVFARQLDDEARLSDNTQAKATCDGGTFWALSFKTESTGTAFRAINGCQAELLGGLIYPVTKLVQPTPMFQSVDSNVGYYGIQESVHGSLSFCNPLVDETLGGVNRQLNASPGMVVATVNTAGTAVLLMTGSFSALVATEIVSINGADYVIGKVNHVKQSVNTSGTAVTYIFGADFSDYVAGMQITISGVNYTIATVSSNTSLTLTDSAGTQSGTNASTTNLALTTSAGALTRVSLAPLGNVNQALPFFYSVSSSPVSQSR